MHPWLNLLLLNFPYHGAHHDIYPIRSEWVPPSGVVSSASAASREKGELMASELGGLIAQALRKELG